MANPERCVYVYDSFSDENPSLLGRLYVNTSRGGETYSFEFEREWLRKSGLAKKIDPNLMPSVGRQFSEDRKLFGFLADAAPDRWGRTFFVSDGQ